MCRNPDPIDWNAIRDVDRFLDTCDGGDPGTLDSPAIWLFGLEPGYSEADLANSNREVSVDRARLHAYDLELQLQWRFNVSAFKLLAALAGGHTTEYMAFAERCQPFVRGSKGYFKGNLYYPYAFRNVRDWPEALRLASGNATKGEYRQAIRDARFPVIRHWIAKCRPRLFIGIGVTHVDEFKAILGCSQMDCQRITVKGRTKTIWMSDRSDLHVPLVVLPHLTGGPNGLNSHEAIEKTADLIREKLRW